MQTKYTYKQIWLIAYPILISLLMEQMIGMTDTAFLGRVGEVELGASAIAGVFYMVIFMVAFGFSTMGGVLLAQVMKVMSGGKINPVIGAAGVSAVPMAARVCQKVVQQEFPGSYVLMHAMGPNVAGVIGTAVAAGTMLTLLTK